MSLTFLEPEIPTISKLWGKKVSAPNPGKFICSNYYLPDIHQLFKKIFDEQLDITKQFVLCPQYKSSKNNRMADVQFTVTGTIAENETPIQTARRELAEEIGVIVPEDEIETSVYRMAGKYKTVQNFICRLNNGTKAVSYDESKWEMTDNKDIKGKKIQVLIYGELDLLLKFADEIKTPLYSTDSDPKKNQYYLAGFRIVALMDVMRYYHYDKYEK